MLAKVLVVLQSGGDPIPRGYPQNLTAAILAKIGEASPELAGGIHDGKDGSAYRHGYKVFKPMSHSLLLGLRYDKEKGVFNTPETACFYLGWREDVVAAFKAAAKKNSSFEVAGARFRVAAVADIDPSPPTREFTAWGPVVATVSGHKLGIDRCYAYLGADDPAGFADAVKKNLLVKYEATHGKPYEGELSVSIAKPRDLALKWSDVIGVKGVVGRFRLDCSEEMLAFAYSVGLGCKNAIGFGSLMPAV